MQQLNIRKWHRRLGMISFLMIMWLALSGLLINHSDRFGFNEWQLNISWLNSLYGLQDSHISQAETRALSHKEDLIYCLNTVLYFNSKSLGGCESGLEQGLYFHGMLLVLNKEALFVLTEQGELLDALNFSLLGKTVNNMTVDKERLLLREAGHEGGEWWQLNLESLEWFAFENETVELADDLHLALTRLPKQFQQEKLFPGMSVERVLLDAHSGRLFGSLGVFVVDFFALVFVFMSLSGFYIYLKRQS